MFLHCKIEIKTYPLMICELQKSSSNVLGKILCHPHLQIELLLNHYLWNTLADLKGTLSFLELERYYSFLFPYCHHFKHF